MQKNKRKSSHSTFSSLPLWGVWERRLRDAHFQVTLGEEGPSPLPETS